MVNELSSVTLVNEVYCRDSNMMIPAPTSTQDMKKYRYQGIRRRKQQKRGIRYSCIGGGCSGMTLSSLSPSSSSSVLTTGCDDGRCGDRKHKCIVKKMYMRNNWKLGATTPRLFSRVKDVTFSEAAMKAIT